MAMPWTTASQRHSLWVSSALKKGGELENNETKGKFYFWNLVVESNCQVAICRCVG